MAAPHQELPLVARQHLVEQVLDRLMRPDDVRELPQRFIQPGFYGIGGVGKSRLLREIEVRARSITPYVVAINFDCRQAAYVPGTPWDLLRYLVAQLAEIDRCCRNPLQRLRWGSVNPFRECQRIMTEAGPLESASQSIVAIGSHVEDINMAIAQPIPPNLEEALDKALTHLGVRVKVRRQFGGLEAKPRPLVVILLDTLETASKPLRAWLPTHFPALFTHNLLWYHVLIVAAGRQQMPGLVATELPPFTEAESIEFLRHYYVHQQSVDRRFADPALQRALREDTPTRCAILELAQGIPLLLMLLAELAAHTSGRPFVAPEGPPPEGQQARLHYVVEHYIRRLEVEAQDDREAAERYRLLLYNAVPRRIPNDGLIAALLHDLPGVAYPAALDSRALFNRLRRESFVHEDAAGGLVFHEVVREGFLAHLKASDRQRWRELHRRAASWWQAEGGEVEALYHAVQADYEGVIGDLRRRIEAALEAGEWSQAQALIGATTELDLQPADQAWMTLYKAELAWGEGNRPLVYRRLGRLLDRDELPAPAADRLAADLERWFKFAPEMEPEAVAYLDPFALGLLLWWARQRGAPRIEAHALRGLGDAALRQARLPEAERHYGDALAVSSAIGYRLGEAHALQGLGEAALIQARVAEAVGHYQGALAMYRAIGHRLGEANALLGLGDAILRQACVVEAVGHYETALAVSQAIGYRQGEAHALLGLGDAAFRQAHVVEAERRYGEALAVYRTISDRRGEAHALLGLGEATRIQARLAEAVEHYKEALAVYHAIGDRLGEANTLRGLGEAAFLQARLSEAECHFGDALAVSRAIGYRLGEAHTLLGLGATALKQDRTADAERCYGEALVAYRAIGNRMGEANALLGLGAAILSQARTAEAMGHLEAALAVSRAIGYRSGEAHALVGLGEVALRQACVAEAVDHYQAALALYRAIGDRLGEANALQGLGDAARMQDRYENAQPYFEEAFALYMAVGMPFETLRFALTYANKALDQAQRHRQQGNRVAMRQALDLARWLLTWAEQAYAQTDSTVSAQYTLPLQALRLRLGDF